MKKKFGSVVEKAGEGVDDGGFAGGQECITTQFQVSAK